MSLIYQYEMNIYHLFITPEKNIIRSYYNKVNKTIARERSYDLFNFFYLFNKTSDWSLL